MINDYFSLFDVEIECYIRDTWNRTEVLETHNPAWHDEGEECPDRNVDEMKTPEKINEEEQNRMSQDGLVVEWCAYNFAKPILNGTGCIQTVNVANNSNCNDDLKQIESKEKDKSNSNYNHDSQCKYCFDCEIYKKVKNNYECTESNYNHIFWQNHFNFDYSNKPQCRYNLQCKAFKRLSRMNEDPKNYKCHRFDDLCHLCIYRYSPRMERNNKIMGSCDDNVLNNNIKKR